MDSRRMGFQRFARLIIIGIVVIVLVQLPTERRGGRFEYAPRRCGVERGEFEIDRLHVLALQYGVTAQSARRPFRARPPSAVRARPPRRHRSRGEARRPTASSVVGPVSQAAMARSSIMETVKPWATTRGRGKPRGRGDGWRWDSSWFRSEHPSAVSRRSRGRCCRDGRPWSSGGRIQSGTEHGVRVLIAVDELAMMARRARQASARGLSASRRSRGRSWYVL